VIDLLGSNLLTDFAPDLKAFGKRKWNRFRTKKWERRPGMQIPPDRNLKRRSFLAGAAAAIGSTALSYARIPGANDRISLGHIGVGRRGRELASVAAGLKDAHKVEMTAVCDLWKVNRERATQAAAQNYARPTRSFQYLEDMLALNDIDAVIIHRRFSACAHSEACRRVRPGRLL
jgi:hypothetical protein